MATSHEGSGRHETRHAYIDTYIDMRYLIVIGTRSLTGLREARKSLVYASDTKMSGSRGVRIRLCVPVRSLSFPLPSLSSSLGRGRFFSSYLSSPVFSLSLRASNKYVLSERSVRRLAIRTMDSGGLRWICVADSHAGGWTDGQADGTADWLAARAAGVRATSMRFSLAHAHARIRTCIATERRTKEGGTRGECRDARPKNIHPFLRPRNRGKS